MSERAPRADDLARIDAVVVNYNGEQHLGPCLAGLAVQGGRLGEVIVVDNASSDRGLEVVRERAPRARIVEMGDNRGPCPARNRGLREATTPWVLLLDNDAALAPGVLELLVAAARENPRAALVQPRSVFASEPERVHYDGGELHYVGLFSLRNFYAPLASARGEGSLEVGGAVSVAMLARRELVLEAGGFDEGFFILFEDLDLSFRLRALGHSIVSVEHAICHHRGGTPGISFREAGRYPDSRVFFHTRNRRLYLAKCYRWRTLVVCAPGLIAYEFVWLAFAIASGNFLALVRGQLGFVRQLGPALRARRRFQRARVVADRDLLVGGPLTIAPQLASRGFKAAVMRALDRWLAAWWSLARRFAG